jgi:hypothetical protein
MPMRRLCLAMAAMLATAAATPDQWRDRGLHRAIQAIVTDIRPDDARATPGRIAAGIRLVDANGDAVPDYLISLEAISYPGWCGTGGCRTQLWLGRKGSSPLKIFDAQVRETGFRTVAHHRVLDVDLHGSACHTFGASACPASFVWDSRIGRLVEHRVPDGSGVIRLLRPLESLDRAPPAPVRTRLQRMAAQCRAAGGKMDAEAVRDAASTVPDIDGDGLRDWLIAYPMCAITGDGEEPVYPMVLFASAGRPASPEAAAEARQFEIRLSRGPASVFAVKGKACLEDEVGARCTRIPLRWNPRSRRLEAAARR